METDQDASMSQQLHNLEIRTVIPIKCCVLRKIPAEIRALIFHDSHDCGRTVIGLAMAFNGNKEIRDEVIEIMYKVSLLVLNYVRGQSLVARPERLTQRTIQQIREVKIREYSDEIRGSLKHAYNFPYLVLLNMLESAKLVTHFHSELAAWADINKRAAHTAISGTEVQV